MRNKSGSSWLALPFTAILVINALSSEPKSKEKLEKALVAEEIRPVRFAPEAVPMTRFGFLSTYFELIIFFILVALVLVLYFKFNLRL